ncbi:hypothetical protein MPNT_40034 [Candidatus Methylacidithermus pantelleriae]|uniref:Uncharacterized protein n=1 Tax=Candidatus Methylacidithermus pantelleriae TaxID=2744239 RepID=A0A8J2FP80_9BACT|nr:hypothetical protein MPNT_40034 [Candidatus Methylacidithermus pantelleriae]
MALSVDLGAIDRAAARLGGRLWEEGSSRSRSWGRGGKLFVSLLGSPPWQEHYGCGTES